MLSYKADIEAKDKNNQTHLQNAAKYSEKGIVQLLLKHKADIKARNEGRKKPLQLARARSIFFPQEENETVQHFLMECKKRTTNI